MAVKKILIVEDEPNIAESLQEILEILDYQVSGIASSYNEAINLLETEEVNLVLLDIQLKGEKSGIDVAKTINERFRIPYVFTTAYTDSETVSLASELGPFGYIVKPYGMKDISPAIEIAISKHQSISEVIVKAKNKDKFYSMMAHDLRGPFGSILGITRMMNDNSNVFSKEKMNQYISLLNDSSENTFNLLENLLEWSCFQTGSLHFKPVSININSLINKAIETIKGMSDAKNIQLNNCCDIEEDIVLDINMMRTVLRNLITNSIKFTPSNGHIDINVKHERSNMVLTIEDNGVGMTEDTIAKVFSQTEKLSTLGTNSEKGTGLGLLIVKEFVDKHKGSIKVKSVLGKGSEFTISLPKQ